MNKKKILIVGNSFFPENSPRAFRTTELAKEFSREGHDVTVLIPKTSKIHDEFENEYNLRIIDLGKRRYKILNLNSGGNFIILVKRIIRRVLNYFFYYPNIEWMFKVRKKIKKLSGFDLLITIAAPHSIHWGTALTINKENNIANIWVADCGDPFMGTTTDTFSPPFYFKFGEKYWNRKCDYISVPFEGAKNAYYKEFHKKIIVIPQGFRFEEDNFNSINYTPNRVPTFAYTGLLIPGARDPKPLIDYIISLNIEFKFIFYTQSLNMLSKYTHNSNKMIEVRNYIPRDELLMIMSKMDFMVNFNNNVTTQLPSKLIDYYISNRPILSINSFDFDKKIVSEFLKGDYHNQLIIENPKKYKIENVCQQFLELV